MGAMMFGQHQAGGVHIRARDVRMDVDAAGHRDKPARIHRFVRFGAVLRGCDDCIVADPKIADFVMAIGGIDDTRAFDAGQHGLAFASPRRAPMRARASATLVAPLRAEAVAATRVPMSDECMTAS